METVIIGLPTSGKTTIFNALTGRSVPVGDFSSAGRQVHLADVQVPDARVDRLSALYRPKKTTYATVLFRDPPLAYQEDGALSPAGLGEVRKADAVTVVLRAFENESVPHPLREVNPLRDLARYSTPSCSPTTRWPRSVSSGSILLFHIVSLRCRLSV